MYQKFKFIHIFGTDGSGKTTLSYILFKSNVIFAKNGNVIIRKRRRSYFNDLLAFLFERLSPARIQKGGDGRIIKIHGAHKLWPLWIILEVLGMRLWYILRVMPYKRKCVCIFDRFIIDMIVSDTYMLGIEYFKKLLCLYTKTFSDLLKKSIFIHVDAPIYIIMERRKDETDPAVYIYTQKFLYNFLSKVFNAIKLDTSITSISGSFKIAVSILNELIRD
ncbi:MAG: hypothetical protein QW076_04345 [Candidatus Anstonellales archaeon]